MSNPLNPEPAQRNWVKEYCDGTENTVRDGLALTHRYKVPPGAGACFPRPSDHGKACFTRATDFATTVAKARQLNKETS